MSNKPNPTSARLKAQPKPPLKPQPANTTKQIIAVGDDALELTITTRPVPASETLKQSRAGKETAATKRTPPKKK
jgi:hypothetical protein